MANRFDYVKYDVISIDQQAAAKKMCQELENFILVNLQGRPASLALTKLEEVYMWIGKGIRDQQSIMRKVELQEERNDE